MFTTQNPVQTKTLPTDFAATNAGKEHEGVYYGNSSLRR